MRRQKSIIHVLGLRSVLILHFGIVSGMISHCLTWYRTFRCLNATLFTASLGPDITSTFADHILDFYQICH